MPTTLVIGGTGFVGRELVQALHAGSASRSGSNGSLTADATDPADLARLLDREQPDLVVNCVGLADVDKAEKDEELATRLNVGVVENLAAAQRRLGFRLVHISTDYVFDGTRGNYREDDPTNPINVYGRTKVAGERAAEGVPGALILRISSPYGVGYGARKVQFFRYIVDSLRAGKRPRALTDQRLTPTFLPDLGQAVQQLRSAKASGLFHIGAARPVTRYEFATEIARVAGLDPGLVEAATSHEMTAWAARRPLDTSLNVEKSLAAGVRYTPVPEALAVLLRQPVL